MSTQGNLNHPAWLVLSNLQSIIDEGPQAPPKLTFICTFNVTPNVPFKGKESLYLLALTTLSFL